MEFRNVSRLQVPGKINFEYLKSFLENKVEIRSMEEAEKIKGELLLFIAAHITAYHIIAEQLKKRKEEVKAFLDSEFRDPCPDVNQRVVTLLNEFHEHEIRMKDLDTIKHALVNFKFDEKFTKTATPEASTSQASASALLASSSASSSTETIPGNMRRRRAKATGTGETQQQQQPIREHTPNLPSTPATRPNTWCMRRWRYLQAKSANSGRAAPSLP